MLFDEFFEHVDEILERWLTNQHTSDDLAFAMHAYNESLKLTDLSPKLKSKQLTLQLICLTLLGNRKEAQDALAGCTAFFPKVKDKNQRAQQAVYTYVCKPIPEHYETVQKCLEEIPDKKKNEYNNLLKNIEG